MKITSKTTASMLRAIAFRDSNNFPDLEGVLWGTTDEAFTGIYHQCSQVTLTNTGIRNALIEQYELGMVLWILPGI